MRCKKKFKKIIAHNGRSIAVRWRLIAQMAHETLFPKNVEKKIAESKKVEQKMNAVDFSGSTASDDVPDEKVEQKKLVEDIKKTSGNDFGWAID